MRIRVTFYEHEKPFTTITDDADMATAYINYAQLNGYGITLEVL